MSRSNWVVGIASVLFLAFLIVKLWVLPATEANHQTAVEVSIRPYGPHNHVLGLKNGHPLNRTEAEPVVSQYLTTHGLEVVGVYERRQEGDPTSLIVRKKQ